MMQSFHKKDSTKSYTTFEPNEVCEGRKNILPLMKPFVNRFKYSGSNVNVKLIHQNNDDEIAEKNLLIDKRIASKRTAAIDPEKRPSQQLLSCSEDMQDDGPSIIEYNAPIKAEYEGAGY